MSLFTLYLFFILIPSIHSFLLFSLVVSGLSGVSLVLTTIGKYTEPEHPEWGNLHKVCKSVFITSLLLTFITNATPNQKDMFLLTGGWVALNNEEVQKLPTNVLGALNSYLEEVKKDIANEEVTPRKAPTTSPNTNKVNQL